MTFAVLGELNWLAVIVATIVYFALGGLWFSPPVFGRQWTAAIGWDMAEGERPSPLFYLGPLVTSLISVIAIAMLAEATGSDTFAEGIVLGLVAGIGLVGAILFVTGYFDPKKPQPMVWTAITAGYHILGTLIAAVLLSIWS